MCGIAGIFAYNTSAPPVFPEELLRIRDSMARRGPDGCGSWIALDRRVGLAHRRLAIIDIGESGAQPMATRDGLLRITFNGEIYNYRELRRQLEQKGYVFHSGSDTEVLLHLYADRGSGMVEALRGMYAFAIWDDRQKEIFAARDPFGIKPLYYSDNGETLRFASQVKALIQSGAVDLAPEPAGSVGFLVWGHVPEPFTLYRGIRSLPSGSWMRVRQGADPVIRRFFDVGEEFLRAAEVGASSIRAKDDIVREAVADTVRHHLVADVPIGVFLSAGIDSTTIAGHAAAQSGDSLNAVTLGFAEYRGSERDEIPLATQFARRAGISHRAHWIDRRDFDDELPRILESMDQPTIDGVNTYFVSRAAARSGMKVALSGIGGDELFGGYPSYWQVPRAAALLGFARAAPFVGRFARWALAPLVSAVSSPKYASLLEYGSTVGGAYLLRRALYLPWEVSSILDPATVRVGLEKLRIVERLDATVTARTPTHARIAALELSWYLRNQLLRDADWAGMAHSLEIRVPLIDIDFFRRLAPLMVSKRYPTKTEFAQTLPGPHVQALLERKKTGFTTPVGEWTGGAFAGPRKGRGLRAWAGRVLPPQPKMFRALAVVSDAFGGSGGIAKFNRDLATAVSSMPLCAELVVVPRLITSETGRIPPRIRFVGAAAGGKVRFVFFVLGEVLRGRFDLVIGGHINLAPLTQLVALMQTSPSLLVIHGIDAWAAHDSLLVRSSLRFFSCIAGVSKLTLNRFAGWASIDATRLRLLPNCVDARSYGPGPKSAALAKDLKLHDRTVILTLGRLASEERYKGFDEIIEALPVLARHVPNISYLVCGDGPDLPRLRDKARALGVSDRVLFAGYVPEGQKADYYRLADAYVMPSNGEGFGIVFLEALACGIPVLGSLSDGGREALMDGALGHLVDPSNQEKVVEGVLATLRVGRGPAPDGLSYYSWEAFVHRASMIVENTLMTRTRTNEAPTEPGEKRLTDRIR